MNAIRVRTTTALSYICAIIGPVSAVNAQQVEFGSGLTDVEGVLVGQHTLAERLTGCTVVLFEERAVAGVDVRGSAPGTRETDLLDPVNLVERVDAFVLSGGSAFGLDVAGGVSRYLEERGRGYAVGPIRVPIVPQAILFDLFVGDDPGVRPDAECGYRAAAAASSETPAMGNVGAGAGATVGKLVPEFRAMKSGMGTASLSLPSGLVIGAIVAVNSVGDIVDPATGEVLAGALGDEGTPVDVRKLLRSGDSGRGPDPGANTTIGVVVTNADLTRAQVTKMAQNAHDGLARTIYPAHTMYDGDVMFGAATGRFRGDADMVVIGALAADVVAEAVLRAVQSAVSIPGYPALRDLPAPK